jgi:hypothetical protein
MVRNFHYRAPLVWFFVGLQILVCQAGSYSVSPDCKSGEAYPVELGVEMVKVSKRIKLDKPAGSSALLERIKHLFCVYFQKKDGFFKKRIR